MASESPVCAMGFDYRQVLDIEMNGGLNGKEIDEGNASSITYLSAQVRRPFVKTKELSEEFSQMEAFSELFMEVGTDDGAAVAFVKGILPQGLAAEVDKAAAENLLAH